jgi:hypothetical protein
MQPEFVLMEILHRNQPLNCMKITIMKSDDNNSTFMCLTKARKPIQASTRKNTKINK